MKKILLVVLGFTIAINLFADPVNPEQAKKIAKNFYLQTAKNKDLTDINLTLAFIVKSKDVSNQKGLQVHETSILYIFNVNQNDGFVIVAADNDVTPILGYTLSGSYSGAEMPPAFQKLIEKYKKEIIDVSLNSLQADKEIQSKWNKLENGESLVSEKGVKSVNPLLATIWNQSPYYNYLCPGGSVTGCPATAMGQIMKYWNYPASGTGFHSYNEDDYGTLSANFAATTYDWGSMPDNVTSNNYAVGILMFHCGVAVEMNYSPTGSGGWVIENDQYGSHPACVESALKNYFGYSTSMQGLQRENYTNAAWIQLLKTDLDAGRPIQYGGWGQGGHTFVCDGYDNYDYFHMNWGWGGMYDGFFDLDALNPGTGGTGSGAGTYNQGQQALIGIQPASGGGTSIINMYSSITITPNPIDFALPFDVNADVINNGTSNFSGDFCAALFTSAGTFIDFIQTLTASGSPLPPNYHYTGGLTFSSTGMITVPGSYIIGIFYRDPGGNWNLAGDASFANPVSVTISSPVYYIQQYSPIVATPATFVQGQAASVNVNLVNNNTSTYYGVYQAALYDLNGNFVQTIGIYNETIGLPAGYTYLSPYITFSTSAIIATPGTYILAILELENGYSTWYLVGGQYYPTPVNINVVAPALSPDIYESNNIEGAAYNLSLNFSGNTATQNTSGSNIHIGGDLDYYQINLATGYNYSITARVHDSYNSGNGQTYTGDVMFSYKYNSVWSDNFDDIMPSNINIPYGGTIIFNVAPYFTGETGTYLLDMTITQIVGIEENEEIANSITLYPNPANDFVNLDFTNCNQKISAIKVYDNIGKEICSYKLADFSDNIYQIPISDLSNGLYFLSVVSENKVFTKKFTIQK
ncbi:MAG: thiol protease/hemagglutinin PrtT [Bacteroidetes bacterium]|nr:thiol protease/hemagglutinin PrtT [Bacteroidota bacterium]